MQLGIAAWWLTLAGGSCLLVGLAAALLANRYQTMKALLPASGRNRHTLTVDPRARGTIWFYVGLILTAAGVAMQTAGALLPMAK